MTSFFPDLNVWLALSVIDHVHGRRAWQWLEVLPKNSHIFFSRYTQIGYLRLLSNRQVMGRGTLTLNQAWAAYDRWHNDSRVDLHPEPAGLDEEFRASTAPFGNKPASKSVGDCYLLAFSKRIDAVLVTFDRALLSTALNHGCDAISPE